MQVDLASVKCALIVCDTEWRGCSSSEESGEEHLAAADYLRLDSMVRTHQPVTRNCNTWERAGMPLSQMSLLRTT